MRNLLAALCCLALAQPALADEGMWTYDAFPSAQVKATYGFEPDAKWLDHTRLASARLAGGCSASFVSPDGLVLTNHHCAHSCIEQLSTAKRDFVAEGFLAKTEKDEVRCPEIELNQLVAIDDVTDRVLAATKGLAGGKAFNEAQRGEMARIEKQCATGDEVRCDVVTLYQGGRYHLYKYRRFQDVRLVAAPEFAIAFFGGDPDNFNFPRYDLDFSFLRVYENGKPAKTEHWFPMSVSGPKDGDLVFVSGHPGGTNRKVTMAELELERDARTPQRLLYLAELRGILSEFSKTTPEHKRISSPSLFYIENSFKARQGRLAALHDEVFMAGKREAEAAFKKQVAADAALATAVGPAWDTIAAAMKRYRLILDRHGLLEEGRAFNSDLFGLARLLVRAADEMEKPNEQRLREYADARLPQLKQRLGSEAPIYDDLEITTLGWSLTVLRRVLGADDAVVKKVLGERSPDELAQMLVKGSKLKDAAVRKALFAGGRKAIAASQDPFIVLARAVDGDARAVRTLYEEEVEAPVKRAHEAIAKADFAVHGTSTYPDATFTLRLSYGRVAGWTEDDGRVVPALTTIAGAFERATGRDPFKLPKSWLTARTQLDGKTSFDVATTNDIIGGNSGSPLVNAAGELVGLVFDGNIHSLAGDYGFDARKNRTVAVTSSALLETLEHVYGAKRLVGELRGPVATK
jgi:hypothetical protein